MRISDWSSDVCSSDLRAVVDHHQICPHQPRPLMSFARARLRHIRMKGKFARWTLTRRMLMARGKAVTAGSAPPSDRNHSDEAHRTQNARPFPTDVRGHARHMAG